MNLHWLRLFCTVVETGSFTMAARALFISQPALSTQIKRLEKSLGTPLFRQTKGGVLLTESGHLLYEAGQVILAQCGAVEERISGLHSRTGGTLTIGVGHTGAMYALTGALPGFRQQHPEIRVSIRVEQAENILRRLYQGTIDVGMEWEPLTHAGVEVIPLAKGEFPVVLAADHPLAGYSAMPQEVFVSTPYLALEHGRGVPGVIEVALIRAGLPPLVSMRLPSVDAQKRMIEAGLGVGLISTFGIEREVRLGLLKAIPLEGFEFERSVVLLLLERRPRLPVVERFADFMQAHFRSGASPRS